MFKKCRTYGILVGVNSKGDGAISYRYYNRNGLFSLAEFHVAAVGCRFPEPLLVYRVATRYEAEESEEREEQC